MRDVADADEFADSGEDFYSDICIVWICGEEKKIKFGKAAINGQTRTPISLEVDSLFTRIERYLIKSGN